MRIWDIKPKKLCRNHLLGEHRELHAIWSILTKGKKGYSRHPETLRWKGKLKALYKRHSELALEMQSRCYDHRSILDKSKATGKARQDTLITDLKSQIKLIKLKKCGCGV
jgi:hypothetical protein